MRTRTVGLLLIGMVALLGAAGTAVAELPKNMIFFMSGTACPAGSSRLVNANGRMLLVANDPGAIGSTSGKALADREDRKHKHKAKVSATLNEHSISAASSCCNSQSTGKGAHSADVETDESASALPFVQLLACKVD
ncbi:hypothetical protein [Stenotrophomonas rhizophila]|uniref:hypothetical protein n=1 Tax=Stenotrophomonas rhizophila TaxID=216778 RepID=UPI00163A1BE8|nr:hypothetical protein [Stenotrophomonas rhizophila]